MFVQLNLMYVHHLQIWGTLIYIIVIIFIIIMSKYQSSALQRVGAFEFLLFDISCFFLQKQLHQLQ